MSKKEDKTALEKQRLEQKKTEQVNKIENRLKSVGVIVSRKQAVKGDDRSDETDDHADPKARDTPFQLVLKKFDESYAKRKVFAEELLKSRQNCAELKSKINKFVKQQNMLMIKLKSSMGGGGSD
jgi:hypothetical protein